MLQCPISGDANGRVNSECAAVPGVTRFAWSDSVTSWYRVQTDRLSTAIHAAAAAVGHGLDTGQGALKNSLCYYPGPLARAYAVRPAYSASAKHRHAVMLHSHCQTVESRHAVVGDMNRTIALNELRVTAGGSNSRR